MSIKCIKIVYYEIRKRYGIIVAPNHIT